MRKIREEMEYPLNRKNLNGLFAGYMERASGARLKGDRVLFDVCCRRAGYYLRLVKRLDSSPSPGSLSGGIFCAAIRKIIGCEKD